MYEVRLLRRSVVCCLVLSFVRVAQNVPNHGSQVFLGHNYWNSRYSSLDYTEWPGFWNNNNDGRVRYNRANSEFNGQSCGACSCSDLTKTATCTGPTV